MGLGFELKCRLVQAVLRGCDALWATSPDARMVHTEPAIHVVGCEGPEEWHEHARRLTEDQYQAWDMIGGRLEPGLGGAPRYLDVLGVNYYHDNQWEHPSNERLHWHLKDPRRRGSYELQMGLCDGAAGQIRRRSSCVHQFTVDERCAMAFQAVQDHSLMTDLAAASASGKWQPPSTSDEPG